VEPLAFAPVRSSLKGWREKSYRWFTRKPLSSAYLVFTDDPQFTVTETDEWLAPPEVPLAGGVQASATLENEAITITTNRVGHPLLVKVSYHPRWRAEGADGPYLVSPALMLVVPRATTVRLVYGRTASDWIGLALTAAALGSGLFLAVRRWQRRDEPRPAPVQPPIPLDECNAPAPTRRWGAVIPAGLLIACVAARAWSWRSSPPDVMPLYETASRAFSAGRFAEAAEYARHAAGRAAAPMKAELLCLRGESLLRAGQPVQAAVAFQAVLNQPEPNPYVAQALFGALKARTDAGDLDAARMARERLLREFKDSPWARRAQEEVPAPRKSG
jgi:hypothetical protein